MRKIFTIFRFYIHNDIYSKVNNTGIFEVPNMYKLNLGLFEAIYSEISLEFYYKENPKIRIGEVNCCCYMISIVTGPRSENTYCSDKDLSDLITWKRELEDTNRLKKGSRFKNSVNCCS